MGTGPLYLNGTSCSSVACVSGGPAHGSRARSPAQLLRIWRLESSLVYSLGGHINGNRLPWTTTVALGPEGCRQVPGKVTVIDASPAASIRPPTNASSILTAPANLGPVQTLRHRERSACWSRLAQGSPLARLRSSANRTCTKDM